MIFFYNKYSRNVFDGVISSSADAGAVRAEFRGGVIRAEQLLGAPLLHGGGSRTRRRRGWRHHGRH